MKRAVGLAAVLAALSAAVIIGLVGGRVAPYPERITVSGDSYALTAAPSQWTGDEDHLVAGGVGGGAAISYLKFRVDLPPGEHPKRAWLWLGTDGGDLPDLIELSQVPDAGFEEKSLTAANAPRLGNVIASVEPDPRAPAIAFDVTEVLDSSGVYGFAITASSGTESARFVAREAEVSESGAPTITLEWAQPSESASPQLNPPNFTPTPRQTPSLSPSASASPSASDSPSPSPSVSPWPSASPNVSASASIGVPSTSPSSLPPKECEVGPKLVPSCGTLWGVAPGAHGPMDRIAALGEFERRVQKQQLIYHAYHRGDQLFPTEKQIELARDPATPRILFLNWKPWARWGDIARGDRAVDAYLDRLSEHIRAEFPEQFFFSFHHEPENDVIDEPGSGMTAKDYAAAYRHIIERLRHNGITNAVSTMSYMAYIPWNTKPWFPDLYPGDDVVDWVAWDEYAYSDPGYGFGDFAEFMNRRSEHHTSAWPGFYNWAARTFPRKPLMLGEWGVWYSPQNPEHHASFFESARLQLELFPRVKAYVYFETHNADGKDSRVHHTREGLSAFQRLSKHPAFDVRLNIGLNRAG